MSISYLFTLEELHGAAEMLFREGLKQKLPPLPTAAKGQDNLAENMRVKGLLYAEKGVYHPTRFLAGMMKMIKQGTLWKSKDGATYLYQYKGTYLVLSQDENGRNRVKITPFQSEKDMKQSGYDFLFQGESQ